MYLYESNQIILSLLKFYLDIFHLKYTKVNRSKLFNVILA